MKPNLPYVKLLFIHLWLKLASRCVIRGFVPNVDYSSREDVRSCLFPRIERWYIYLSFGLSTSAHPKRSWVDHLFACWRQPRTSEATNLHLVIRRLPSSATNWYTWLLWRSAMSNFRFFWGEPSTLWGHHRSTPLKINVSLLKLNLIQTIWYFLAWVTDYCWNSYQI